MRFLISGRSDGLKKEKKKNTKRTHKSRNRRPWYPKTTVKINIHIFGSTNAQYTVKNVPVFLYAVTMLIFQIRRIISNEKWFNYIVTLFFENAKNLGRSDDAKRRKKEDGLMISKRQFVYHVTEFSLTCRFLCY